MLAFLRKGLVVREPGFSYEIGLTAHERRILELIGEGLTNRQIGQRMFLAEQTVKNYVSALLQKLGMERRTQAAAYAARLLSEQHGPPEKPEK